MKKQFAALALALLSAAGCSTTPSAAPASAAPMAAAAPAQSGAFVDITVPQYLAMAETTDFFVVNVHIPFEGDLPGTEASIAFNEIQNHLGELPADKSARILLYCKSGRMSVTAAQTLAGLGYTAVYSLAGGMNAWTAAGQTLASAQ